MSVEITEPLFTIIPSKEIPGLISFRMDWLDLLAVQGMLVIQRLVNHFISAQLELLRSGSSLGPSQ